MRWIADLGIASSCVNSQCTAVQSGSDGPTTPISYCHSSHKLLPFISHAIAIRRISYCHHLISYCHSSHKLLPFISYAIVIRRNKLLPFISKAIAFQLIAPKPAHHNTHNTIWHFFFQQHLIAHNIISNSNCHFSLNLIARVINFIFPIATAIE